MFQNEIFRKLTLVAGLWLMSTAAAAAPAGDAMPLGARALPPAQYLDFCQRQPLDCGAEPQAVLAGAAKAKAEREALFAMAQPNFLAATATAPAAMRQSKRDEQMTRPQATAARAWTPDPAIALTPAILRNEDVEATVPRMTSRLWSRLNRVNDRVNRAFPQATDAATYGTADYWATPIVNGVNGGDCEDFVLEKRRALLAAGLPREALNIAIVVTPWGETHAVLLVNTSDGEFVLDNLSPWVTPWAKTAYRWRQRQVDGDPFKWAMVRR